ncbi:NADH-quinone oxidoreductase subunit J [Nitrospira moscoviensis]|uniref:NADH-quinone oxidoreductase subunit J n=1 Tax=Nitrospira moscoviensis TaxID=42253 RepID=A0A0K2GE19_NITMO|nr:NADH-quinone oxidoreductase subunit J [Nitrospira moscoviensis]ALA59193.1 NADH-quinone oxidoreductase, membrane subunit J [Nitrospira moscoviensis]
MELLFYLAAAVSVLATVRVITHLHAVHALLYLVVSLMALAVIFYLLGAQFAAALEIIIYAGAIMVLFIFVVMLLNQGPRTMEQERRWLRPGMWIGPGLLALVLLAEVVFIIAAGAAPPEDLHMIRPKAVAISLYGPYVIGVELASMLLLPGLIGAYHLGRRLTKDSP